MNKDVSSILKAVTKPGRYSGGEYGQIIKDKNQVKARFAFCFPDTYEIGMSNLGVRILYGVLNEEKDVWCERVYDPWIDMQEKMREHNIPLTATLFKNGEEIALDVRDPRIIRLINFFNNSLFYEKCEYSLSHLDQDDLENIMSEEFRLELKYEPYGENVPEAYENQPTLFDTIVVHGGRFALINNDFPWYYVDELISFKGNYYSPYVGWQSSGWLELFGF